jgi:type VI secretion system protein ImpL
LNGRETLVTKQNGPWSLFRLLDQCNVQTRDGDDQLKISITNAGMQAQYLLTSSHSPNPFQRSLLSDFALTDSL